MTSNQSAKNTDIASLDRLTGGAFTAATAGERASRIRDWLLTQPGHEQLADVFKELSVKDKGAAKLVREKLDEARRAKGQEALGAEWSAKAQALIDTAKLNIADALAWQRDAAKAGAPLSKEPLLTLKGQLSERVKGIEDLQHQVQVQREAAVLLAQRIEVLSTKALADAQTAVDALRTDVQHWQSQAETLVSNSNWVSVDAKFPALLDASKGQLLVVWDAFQAALALAMAAAQDAAAPLPPVPVWADEIRALRGVPAEVAPKVSKPKVDPELRAQAQAAVKAALATVEQEVGEGHGKASAGAAAGLRNALKEFGKLIDAKLENQAHAALSAAHRGTSPRDKLPQVVHKLRPPIGLQSVQHRQQTLGCLLGLQGVVPHKRLAERRLHGARLQGCHHGQRLAAGDFNRGSLQQHIERRLGGAVAVPTAFAVVFDAAHTRRQLAPNHPLPRRQQGRQVFEQEARPHGIEMQGIQQVRGVEFIQPFFGATANDRERPRGVHHQMKRPLPCQRLCTRGDAGLAQQVQPWRALARHPDHRRAARVMLQLLQQGAADRAARTDHQGAVALGQGQHHEGVLLGLLAFDGRS